MFLFYHHTLLCSFLLTSILLCVRSLFSSVSSITQVPGDVTESGNYNLSSHLALFILTYFFSVFSCVCFSCSPHHHISQVPGEVIRSGNNIWDCERSGEWIARRHQRGTETHPPSLARSPPDKGKCGEPSTVLDSASCIPPSATLTPFRRGIKFWALQSCRSDVRLCSPGRRR